MAGRTDTLRVVFCWSEVGGYMASCWRALAAQPGVSVHVLHPRAISPVDNPFDANQLMHGLSHEMFSVDQPDLTGWLAERVAAQRPDVVVHCGWIVWPYTALLRAPELSSVPMLLGMDSPWLGTLAQRLARFRLRSLVDRMRLVVVASERSAEYARRIGFDPRIIRMGYYGFDDRPLAPVSAQRTPPLPRRFLFVGRYVPQKDLQTLARAYAIYRGRVSEPWPLTCCGRGPDGRLLAGLEGVEDRGFQQPTSLPEIFAGHGVFVMASHFEPWGVVIAEAAASGMPVVCTTACGAGVDIIRPYYNGVMVPPGDPEAFARALIWMHDHHDCLHELGRRGRQLAAAYTAEAWGTRWRHYLLDAAGRS